MEIPAAIKKPPVLIGGAVVLLIVIIVAARKGGSTSTSSQTDNYSSYLAATSAANTQIAQINAETQRDITLGGYSRDVSLAGITASREVEIARLTTGENVALASAEYAYDLGNKQIENNRILGLTQQDTIRLLSTQENQTRLTLGITEIDANRFIAERALQSEEVRQARELTFRHAELESGERVADWTSSRALTYAQIVGRSQVDAASAAKPKWYDFLAQGVGRGLGTFIGGL